jgi:2-(1,2-epoxy-1,2-dihydrophenyl)acetyl-CoA isomerase
MSIPIHSSTKEYVAALRAEPRTRIKVDRPREHVAVVRMADEANHNALSGPLTVELQQTLGELVADDGVRVIVLTGTGNVFSVGGDWKLMTERAHTFAEREEGTADLWRWIRQQFGGIARTIVHSDKVFIAAINGDAAGVALAWALNSDLVVAANDARLVTAFGRIGLVPEVGTNWALTRRIGYQKAFELFVTGRTVTGEEAAAIGLVNAAVAREQLDGAVLEWCERICRLPDYVVSMTKPLMRQAADMTFDQAMLAEEFAEPNTFTTRYHREAIASLLAKSTRASD